MMSADISGAELNSLINGACDIECRVRRWTAIGVSSYSLSGDLDRSQQQEEHMT